ncbi:hypothetical protein LUZ60_004912 [Juncus effusus]|nr:hypothetical protein LUZ60_004912 [Juncus effusus]
MAAIRGFSFSGPEVRVLTCPRPFLRGQLSFRPNISQPNFFRSDPLRIHQNIKKFNVHARKKSTSNNEESTEADLEKTKKKRGRPKKITKETSEKEEIPVQITSDLNQEQTLEESVLSEETKDPTSEKEETFVQFTSDLNQTENSEEIKDQTPPKISQKFLDQMTKYDTSLLEPSTKHEQLIAQILNLCEPTRSDTWRPLIGCFGPAKLSFIPYAKPATRVIDEKLHQHYPFKYWSPARFFRAAGSSADRVAVHLARAGQKVDFVGKLGEDLVGSQLVTEMMKAGVGMRQVARCDRLSTAVSRMKVKVDKKDGGLRAECAKKCAEDWFRKEDVQDVYMKRVKMLYFTSWAVLDPDLESALLHSITITKQNKSARTFFDLNLPFPLWHKTPSELKTLLKPFFELSDFIELTSQELKYLLEIPINDEKEGYRTVGFGKREQDEVYGHVEREKVMEAFWHSGMKALFVTDGASRVHYYTREYDGFVRGDENVGLEPASKEMAAAGDALVASIIKMLVREQEDPDSVLDPKYLEDNLTDASLEAACVQVGVSLKSGFYDDSSSDEEETEESEKVEEEEKEKEKVEVFGGALYD